MTLAVRGTVTNDDEKSAWLQKTLFLRPVAFYLPAHLNFGNRKKKPHRLAALCTRFNGRIRFRVLDAILKGLW
ncbi:hypothetical protein AGOR_G00088360 [Albula goreensis]|uniref:Uncharacterized protein n=1 Tax=Albula goreensis TaxID=1534307 RepID=A0A8T3DLP7_9TELE|nr:hypothetical protein AGOR_G00088360 [Albula goreensis]